MPYGFRIRFRFPKGARLPVHEPTWVLEEKGDATVKIVAVDEVTAIAEASDASLLGAGYATEQEAVAAGNRWRAVMQVAFARLNIGVDFHERSPELAGGFSDYALAALAEEHARPVVNDRPGVIVYEEPRPIFASATASAVVMPSMRRAAGTFAAARDLVDLDLVEAEHLAFELYAASFFQPSADARLLMAMMAIEALIDPEPRAPQVRSLVEDLIEQVRGSGLPHEQVSSLVGSMSWLLSESIGQAGRRVVSVLGDRKYHGMRPARFFTKCYELRSALVHGHLTRPERMEVDVHASYLQMMVGELLGRRVLHVTEEWLAERESDGPDS